ncbi:hypothetical protein T12_4009 [Trichinella patagoniensis]|uniref:Peptidase S1 domain-containing protein n=1 Tax=Trichinella patagoniensis TaxID=990121 RepID=A0A0V0Z7Y8_9BILA|nr:hypothetical protein T12_4009 [Trichinella patagoniensis]
MNFQLLLIFSASLAVESLFCGPANHIEDIGSYTVIFFGETSEGVFIDCTGMLIPSLNSNETHTDTVITTRYCLQSEYQD